jgi:hypothetical protein
MTSASNSFATASGSGLASAASEKEQSISARHVKMSAGCISGKEYVTAAMAPAARVHGGGGKAFAAAAL